MSIPRGSSVRLGVITKVGRTFIEFHFMDSLDGQVYRTPMPQPYAGRGGGVLVGIEKDAIVLVTNGPGEKWYCLGIIPDHNFYFNLDGAEDIHVHESSYPSIKEGEICLKSNQGSRIDLVENGNIRINAGASNSLSDIELSRIANALFTRVNNLYTFTEANRLVSGVIKRDFNIVENAADAKTLNFLDSERYELLLKAVGRFPKNENHHRSTTLIKDIFRNPSLAEKREIIYEYANSFNVKDFKTEVSNAKIAQVKDENQDSVDLQTNRTARYNNRTDVLNLNQRNFNHLIEKVEGTLVDIYGNILDINRNIINMPDITEMEFNGNDTNGLRRIYDHHRRSIKFHYEINSRKPISESEPPENDKNKDNAKNFSRWSIDIDGEGLTKINIPASSETGNIPVLGRYFNTRDDNDIDAIPSEGRQNRRDIKIKQFGPSGGATIKSDNYRPETIDNTTVTVGTAHHNLMNTAQSVFKNGSLGGKGQLDVSSDGPMLNSIKNTIGSDGGPDSGANAGGRSLNINLDGSMEMSIGADSIDNKSMLLDTQGGVISHFGRDRNGRSLIHQADGDMIIQIGNDDTSLGQETRPGRLEIHLTRNGGTPQKILIDENGITIDVQGDAVFSSSGNMAIKAGGKLLLHGELIFMYGSVDTDKREIGGSETLIVRAGSPVFQ